MRDRRWTFFVFQGLLTVIILLFFFYNRTAIPHWAGKFAALSVAFLLSLLALRNIDEVVLGSFRVQAALFLSDAVLASLTLVWTQQPRSEIYLTYFLIIFGTALTKNLRQSFLIALVASAAYVMTAWDPGLGVVQESSFWLRLVFLWVMASFAAVLSIDALSERALSEKGHQAQVRQMEQLAAIGRLSGEVAHSIKGPLTTILVDTDVLLQRHGALPAIATELKEIQGEVERCKVILQDLLELGRIEEMGYELFDLREPVRGAVDKLRSRFNARRIMVSESGFEAPAPVLGDRSLLFEAVYQVLQNAEQASPDGSPITLSLRTVLKRPWWDAESGAAREQLELEVADSGRGIESRNLARVFDPFYTTRGREGSGLGLSAALRILNKHSGALEVFSAGLGRGSRFVFSLPYFRQAPAAG
ncbi:MAG: HAMP domain-containing histidine kinase [Elusimicrobia bacterium]|nr:HAMP domain-containing histidine kinase [Elusimicrobiota bacterium]